MTPDPALCADLALVCRVYQLHLYARAEQATSFGLAWLLIEGGHAAGALAGINSEAALAGIAAQRAREAA